MCAVFSRLDPRSYLFVAMTRDRRFVLSIAESRLVARYGQIVTRGRGGRTCEVTSASVALLYILPINPLRLLATLGRRSFTLEWSFLTFDKLGRNLYSGIG